MGELVAHGCSICESRLRRWLSLRIADGNNLLGFEKRPRLSSGGEAQFFQSEFFFSLHLHQGNDEFQISTARGEEKISKLLSVLPEQLKLKHC